MFSILCEDGELITRMFQTTTLELSTSFAVDDVPLKLVHMATLEFRKELSPRPSQT
jgi:hypothetical protein